MQNTKVTGLARACS